MDADKFYAQEESKNCRDWSRELPMSPDLTGELRLKLGDAAVEAIGGFMRQCRDVFYRQGVADGAEWQRKHGDKAE